MKKIRKFLSTSVFIFSYPSYTRASNIIMLCKPLYPHSSEMECFGMDVSGTNGEPTKWGKTMNIKSLLVCNSKLPSQAERCTPSLDGQYSINALTFYLVECTSVCTSVMNCNLLTVANLIPGKCTQWWSSFSIWGDSLQFFSNW